NRSYTRFGNGFHGFAYERAYNGYNGRPGGASLARANNPGANRWSPRSSGVNGNRPAQAFNRGGEQGFRSGAQQQRFNGAPQNISRGGEQSFRSGAQQQRFSSAPQGYNRGGEQGFTVV